MDSAIENSTLCWTRTRTRTGPIVNREPWMSTRTRTFPLFKSQFSWGLEGSFVVVNGEQ